MQIIVHAGAWNTTDVSAQNLELEAARAAIAAAQKHDQLMDAVLAAVNSLELHPALDAGYGSIIQMDGRARMDAGLMDSKGHYGAVLQIEEIKTPISVAKRLIDHGYHSILSGESATRFAVEEGFKRESVFTEKRLKAFLSQREEVPELNYAALAKNAEAFNAKKLSTVGAVGRDQSGYLIAANSTGGLGYGYPGRVGDTALIGAGLYCSEHVAVVATGNGEAILRTQLTRSVEEFYLQYKDLQRAAEAAIERFGTYGEGGVIAISQDGQTAVAYNTLFLASDQI